MKRHFYILLLFIIAFSCKSKTEKTIADTTATNELSETEKLIAQFKPIIEGVWVKTDYIEDLKVTRSPFKSYERLGGVACFQISFPEDVTDSIHVGYSLGNHEGADFTLLLEPGHRSNSLKTNLREFEDKSSFYEIGYERGDMGSNLVIYHFNKNAEIIKKTLYTKVADRSLDNTDVALGIQYITNRLLFNGVYETVEDDVPVQIEFKNNGDVVGLPYAKKYYILTDFAAGPENNVDKIIFDLYSKTQTSYTFRFNADTLSLFNTKLAADSIDLLSDKLKYKFVRKK